MLSIMVFKSVDEFSALQQRHRVCLTLSAPRKICSLRPELRQVVHLFYPVGYKLFYLDFKSLWAASNDTTSSECNFNANWSVTLERAFNGLNVLLLLRLSWSFTASLSFVQNFQKNFCYPLRIKRLARAMCLMSVPWLSKGLRSKMTDTMIMKKNPHIIHPPPPPHQQASSIIYIIYYIILLFILLLLVVLDYYHHINTKN